MDQLARIPDELSDLVELAKDLRWTGSQFATNDVWRRLDPEAWDRGHNPYTILLNAHRAELEDAAHDEEFKRKLHAWLESRRKYLDDPGWYGRKHADATLAGIAYFSMEFGLSEALPIHSGGLGMLAGDHLKSASDLNVPLIGIGLLYQQGYFRQVIAEDGSQLEALPYNDPGSLPIQPVEGPDGRWPRIRLPLPGRTLFVRPWVARVGKTRLYLLDTNDPLNNPWDRGITANLYAAGRDKRLLQELVLGVGGVQLLDKLGIPIDVFHLNEGHAAFAVLARAVYYARATDRPFDVALRATRAGNVFTTHTPVPAAFDEFEPGLVAKYAKPYLEQTGLTLDELLAMGRRNPRDPHEPFNIAYLALRGACHVNAVSRLHGDVSRSLFQVLFPDRPRSDVPIGHVTNGVHVPSWDGAETHELWSSAYGPRWTANLEDAALSVAEVPAADLWAFRNRSRHRLVGQVRERYARRLMEQGAPEETVERARRVLDEDVLTLGFARRFTSYKRPTLLLHDRARLDALLKDRVQIVFAGKAHPNDRAGKELVKEIARYAQESDHFDHMVFLQDYDIALAQELVSGVDVWINTPRVPNEACGTSGMKVLVNGGLHLSTLDGWWAEAYAPELGWKIEGANDAEEADHLYGLLEQEVLPEFLDRGADGVPGRWIERVRASMVRLTPRFGSDRMVREYVEQAYLPAAAAFRRRAATVGELAEQLEAWRDEMRRGWHAVHVADVSVERAGDRWRFSVDVELGPLAPEHVQVELYTDHDGGRRVPMQREGRRYLAEVPADAPAEHYTPRVVPFHPEAFLPVEASEIVWGR